MSEQQTPRLTPELVLMAVQHGMLDDSLDVIRTAISDRLKVIADAAATSLMPGDKFTIHNISPKKYDGLMVEFTGKREGIWLHCLLSTADASRVNNIDRAYVEAHQSFRLVKLRTTHVNVIFRKADLASLGLEGDV